MVDWHPRENMGVVNHLKFKMGSWVEVDTLPQWVYDAHDGYYEGYVEKYGQHPYEEGKVYVGDSLKYKIYYDMGH